MPDTPDQLTDEERFKVETGADGQPVIVEQLPDQLTVRLTREEAEKAKSALDVHSRPILVKAIHTGNPVQKKIAGRSLALTDAVLDKLRTALSEEPRGEEWWACPGCEFRANQPLIHCPKCDWRDTVTPNPIQSPEEEK